MRERQIPITALQKRVGRAHVGQMFDKIEVARIIYCSNNITDRDDLLLMYKVILYAYNPKIYHVKEKYRGYAGAERLINEMVIKHKLKLPKHMEIRNV